MIPYALTMVFLLITIVASVLSIRWLRQSRRYSEQATANFERAADLFDQATRNFQKAAELRSRRRPH